MIYILEKMFPDAKSSLEQIPSLELDDAFFEKLKFQGAIAYRTFCLSRLKSKTRFNQSPIVFFEGEEVRLNDMFSEGKITESDYSYLTGYAVALDRCKTILSKGKLYQVSNRDYVLGAPPPEFIPPPPKKRGPKSGIDDENDEEE